MPLDLGPDEIQAVQGQIYDHLDKRFERCPKDLLRLEGKPIAARLPDFRVCVIQPDVENPLSPWVYMTIGLWQAGAPSGTGHEYMIISPMADARHADSLADLAMAEFDRKLQPGDSVDLGRGWRAGSNCDHLLITLPYPYGPMMEECATHPVRIRLLWAMPITPEEATYAKAHGREALEDCFEAHNVDFTQIVRKSVV